MRRLQYGATSDEDFTIIIEDPCSNSWIYSPYAPEIDPRLKEELYDRTEEENEDLGLNDIITEGVSVDLALLSTYLHL